MPRRYPTLRTFRSVYISPERGTISEGDECCICLNSYNNDTHQAVGVTSNSDYEHVFGRQCLEAYLDSTNPGKNTCPVCRRKWYTRRSTNPSISRDTHTSQVLASSSPLRTSIRDGAESRALQRQASQEHVQAIDDLNIGRHVERLINNMESIEALEATAAPLAQEVRVRLRQVQGRIRAFLDRNDETPEASVSAAVRRSRPHIVSQGTAERTSRYVPDSIVAELDNGQDPYSLLGATFRSSTLSLSGLPAPRAMPRSRIPTPSQRAEAHLRHTQRDDVVLPHSSRESQSHQAINARNMEGHLRAYWNEDPIRMQQSEPLLNHHSEQSHVIEPEHTVLPLLFAGTAANQAMNRNLNNRHSVHANDFADERTQIVLPRHQISPLRRTNNTLGFAYDSQPVGTAPQPILAASMAERPAGLRSRAMPNSPRGLSGMMSIHNFRKLVARTRAR